jgi:hypothetical protein
MYPTAKFLTFSIAALGILPLTSLSVNAYARLTNQSKLSLRGIESVRVGMTVAEASKAAGTQLVSLNGSPLPTKSSCFYVKAKTGPNGVEFMLDNGRIARIDVVKNSRVTTLKGAKIGDSEARIKSLYPGIKVTPHKYTFQTGGHYMTFVPKDSADKNYRLIFETDGSRVSQFRSGKLPQVELVERCG